MEQYIHTSCISPELSQSNFLLEASCPQSLQGNAPGKGCTLESFQICLDTVIKQWNTNVKKIVIISSPIFIKSFHFLILKDVQMPNKFTSPLKSPKHRAYYISYITHKYNEKKLLFTTAINTQIPNLNLN